MLWYTHVSLNTPVTCAAASSACVARKHAQPLTLYLSRPPSRSGTPGTTRPGTTTCSAACSSHHATYTPIASQLNVAATSAHAGSLAGAAGQPASPQYTAAPHTSAGRPTRMPTGPRYGPENSKCCVVGLRGVRDVAAAAATASLTRLLAVRAPRLAARAGDAAALEGVRERDRPRGAGLLAMAAGLGGRARTMGGLRSAVGGRVRGVAVEAGAERAVPMKSRLEAPKIRGTHRAH
jgi:hypothetical protein